MGIPPTGKRIQFSGCSIYHFEDDRIVEQWEYGDMLDMMQQPGIIPALG
jgi:predicted ester cyclase